MQQEEIKFPDENMDYKQVKLLDYNKPNRSSPYCYDSSYQKRWKSLDKNIPDKPVTKNPAETRMGKGKGAPEYWVAVVKPGRVMFEIAGVPEETAREAMRLAANKLPIKTKFVAKEN